MKKGFLGGLCALWLSSPAIACSERIVENNVVAAPICLPAEPLRIVSLDPFFNLQLAISLGAPVVGAGRSGAALPSALEELGDKASLAQIADLGSFQDPDVEMLVSLKPDLILGDAFSHRDFYEQLSNLAPTALIEASGWEEYLQTIAEVIGRADQYTQQKQIYDNRVQGLKDKFESAGTVSFLRIIPGGFQVYMDGPAAYAPMGVLASVGIQRPPFETVDDNTVLKRPTIEGLLELEGDTLLYVVGGGHDSGDREKLISEVTSHPVWSALPAIQNERAYEVNADYWMAFGGLHSANAILDDLERILAQ